MKDILDDLFVGQVSRRKFIERATAAGVTLAILGNATEDTVEAQARRKKPATNPTTPSPQREQKLSPPNIGGGGRVERDFYRDWLKESKVPQVEGYSILDARSQEVHPWPEIEGRGVYLNFSGNVHMDGVIFEIPAGKALAPRRNFFEQVFICLGGNGYTEFGEGRRKNKVSWGEGSLFAGPLNVAHRHFNGSVSKPARLFAITSFPFMLQVFGNLGLINHLNFDFADRYNNNQSDYFTKTVRIRKRWDKTNFIKDIRTAEVVPWPERGGENASIFWDMSGNTILEPHMSEFEAGGYKLGHRHPYEAIILTLNGKGFSLAGKAGLKESESVKIDWQAGSVVSPPFFWYHQHFNTGSTRARYFAMTEGDFPKRLGIPLQVEQIEADREDPQIKKRFEQELKKSGAANQKAEVHHHHDDHAADDHGGIMFTQKDWKRRLV